MADRAPKHPYFRTCNLCSTSSRVFHPLEWQTHCETDMHRRREKEMSVFNSRSLSEKRVLVTKKIDDVKKQLKQSKIDTSRVLEYMEMYWHPSQAFRFISWLSVEESTKAIEEIQQKLQSIKIIEQWQYLDDSGNFLNVISSMNKAISKISVGERNMSVGIPEYSIIRLSDYTAVQCRKSTQKMRHLRLALLSVKDDQKCLLWECKGTVLPLKTQIFLHPLMVGARKLFNGCEYHRMSIDRVESIGPEGSIVYQRTSKDAILNHDGFDNKTLDPNLFQRFFPTIATGLIIDEQNEPYLEYKVKPSKTIELMMSERDIRNRMREELSIATIIQIKKIKNIRNAAALASFVDRSHLYNYTVMVFHGTDADTIPKIEMNGFNRDFSSIAYYGRGTYFASGPIVSHKYAIPDSKGSRFMFVCVMGITNMKIGDKSITKPPLLDDGITQVDTLVNKMNRPSVLVAMKDSNAVPLWLVEYKT